MSPPRSIVTSLPQTGVDLVYDLTTVDAVNLELGLVSSTADDSVTQDQITAVSRMIARMCNRVFALETVQEKFRFKSGEYWGDVLNLDRYPVTDLQSITIDGVEQAATDYDLDAEKGMVYSVWGDWQRPSEIIAIYTGGYSLPEDAPPELARAAIEMIRQQRTTQGESGSDLAVRDIVAGENRVSYFDTATIAKNSDTMISQWLQGFIKYA